MIDLPSAAENPNVSISGSIAPRTTQSNLGSLRSAGMIEYPVRGTMKLASWVMLEDVK